MLDIKVIEYGELLQRGVNGGLETYGRRFNVGDYVITFRNSFNVTCVAGVCTTMSELRMCLVELSKKFEGCESIVFDIYFVVPTRDEDDEIEDDCPPNRFTVLVPYTEFPYREFCACMVAGLVEDTADCYGMDLQRGDYVLVDKAETEGAAYRLAGSYSFIGDKDTLDILKRVVSGAKLLLLS